MHCARLPKGTNCHLDVVGDLLNGCRRRLCKIVRPKLEPDCQSLEIKNEHCRPKKRSSCFINVQTFLHQSCACIGLLKESLFAVHSPSANFAQGLQSSSLLVNFSQSETKSCSAPVLPSSAPSRSAQSEPAFHANTDANTYKIQIQIKTRDQKLVHCPAPLCQRCYLHIRTKSANGSCANIQPACRAQPASSYKYRCKYKCKYIYRYKYR